MENVIQGGVDEVEWTRAQETHAQILLSVKIQIDAFLWVGTVYGWVVVRNDLR
jgi:hypothetical protein